jgi:hypothetical protein
LLFQFTWTLAEMEEDEQELTDSAEGNSVASGSENIQQPPAMDQAVRTQNPLLIDQKSEHGSGDAMAGNHVENPG